MVSHLACESILHVCQTVINYTPLQVRCPILRLLALESYMSLSFYLMIFWYNTILDFLISGPQFQPYSHVLPQGQIFQLVTLLCALQSC